MGDLDSDELVWLRDHGYGEQAVEEALGWFANRGWEVVVAERDRREDMRARGEAYLPGFSHRFWVDLVRVGQDKPTAGNYTSGNTKAEAVIRARRRYGSEQE